MVIGNIVCKGRMLTEEFVHKLERQKGLFHVGSVQDPRQYSGWLSDGLLFRQSPFGMHWSSSILGSVAVH